MSTTGDVVVEAKPPEVSPRQPFQVLSVDGGGFLGLATAKFIADSEQHFNARFSDRFQLYCGTSTGAIIALALAFGKSGAEIVELYRNLGPHVFPYKSWICRSFHYCKSFFISKYSGNPLRELLEAEFGETTLGDLRAKGKMVLITAFSVTNGTPRLFKTNHSPSLTLDDSLTVAEVALASSAAPTFFPVVPIKWPGDEHPTLFCDGGVVANHPALLGLAEALGELRVPGGDVKILSLSTPRMDIGSRKVRLRRRGMWQWRSSLASIFIDGNAAITHEAIKRIIRGHTGAQPLYARIDLQSNDRLEMDLATLHVRGVLENIGSKKAASNEVRQLIAPFLG